MMRHPITFPASAEIVGSGLLITLNSGETEFHLSGVPEPRKASKVRDWPWKSNGVGRDAS
jgi:hypothetical protein